MAIKIRFDSQRNPERPTFLLAKKSGEVLGQLITENEVVRDSLNSYAEISFQTHKYYNDEENYIWDEIVDFRLVYCKEFDKWFEIYVTINEDDETVKEVSGVELAVAELSQINLYDIHINDEEDILNDNYTVTVLYNPDDPKGSLLDRILEKAPHYTIEHVDSTIASIQRTFTFDSTSIYDSFQEIAKEIGCLFVFDDGVVTEDNISIQRGIKVYDLQTNCGNCGYRGEYTDVCPECGSTNLNYGYGQDTTIFVTADELGDDINFDTDEGSVKNCFRLEAGDDLMTATIVNANPNGSQYIWYIPDYMKNDMSPALVTKLNDYDDDYEYYRKDYSMTLPTGLVTQYNSLVDKYKGRYAQLRDEDLEKITNPVIGYSSLMNAFYNVVDFDGFLRHELMPYVDTQNTDAQTEANKLTVAAMSPVAVTSYSVASLSSVNSMVLGMAKVLVDNRYQTKINTSSYNTSNHVWTGNFKITNYSSEEDTATSATINITISEDYEEYVRQKIEKALAKSNTENMSITGLFEKKGTAFVNALKDYGLVPLTTIHTCCDAAVDILREQQSNGTWNVETQEIYAEYISKLNAIEAEMKVREGELYIISGDADNKNDSDQGMLIYVENFRDYIQQSLNFEAYLGTDLFLEFAAFRREDTYSNSNYISTDLSNGEIFDNAREFLKVASDELYKSATKQHSISASLKDLLVIEKFEPLIDHFKVGNWIRIQLDDNVYKLRLIQYELNYNDLSSISVDFSDVTELKDGVSDVESILKQANSIATSYDTVSRQASKGKGASGTLEYWRQEGLKTALYHIQNNDNEEITIDENGLWARTYNDVAEEYDPAQLRITHNIMCYTKDNWQSVSLALGKFDYYNVADQQWEYNKYGLNADFVIAGYVQGSQMVGNDIYGGKLYKYDDSTRTVDKNTYIDLINGKWNLADGNFSYDGSTLTIKANAGSLDIGNLHIETNGHLYYGVNDDPSSLQHLHISNSGVLYAPTANLGNLTTAGDITIRTSNLVNVGYIYPNYNNLGATAIDSAGSRELWINPSGGVTRIGCTNGSDLHVAIDADGAITAGGSITTGGGATIGGNITNSGGLTVGLNQQYNVGTGHISCGSLTINTLQGISSGNLVVGNGATIYGNLSVSGGTTLKGHISCQNDSGEYQQIDCGRIIVGDGPGRDSRFNNVTIYNHLKCDNITLHDGDLWSILGNITSRLHDLDGK